MVATQITVTGDYTGCVAGTVECHIYAHLTTLDGVPFPYNTRIYVTLTRPDGTVENMGYMNYTVANGYALYAMNRQRYLDLLGTWYIHFEFRGDTTYDASYIDFPYVITCLEGVGSGKVTCPDGSTIYEYICTGDTWVPTGDLCPGGVCIEGTYQSPVACWDSSVIYQQVCSGGVWVSSGETCPPVCTEGALQDPFTCWDNSVIQQQVCHNNAWVDSGQTCPPAPCANPTGNNGTTACITGYVNTCVNGTWTPSATTCGAPLIPPWLLAVGIAVGVGGIGAVIAMSGRKKR